MSGGTPDESLVLAGIDGGNPLGFLAAVGAAVLASSSNPQTSLCWQLAGGTWRPVMNGWGADGERLTQELLGAMDRASVAPFEIDEALPFPAKKFKDHLKEAQQSACAADRRTADFLAAFGTEIKTDGENFRDSRFRMVRRGDSAGQGFLAYARRIRGQTDYGALGRALFESWDYRDEGFTLRWDPIDDRRYALQWRDPSKSSSKDGPGTMVGANSLAIEALRLYPTVVQDGQLVTTGFRRDAERQEWFIWPIWKPTLPVDTLRSVLSLPDIYRDQPPRSALARRGIVEVYRSQRIQQRKYYSNFTTGSPV